MTDQTDKLVGLITASSEEEARKIAKSLVEERLAACVSIIPSVRSIYRWKEEIHDDEEFLLVVKTSGKQFEAIKTLVHELHSYETPEIIALPIVSGSGKYLEWMNKNLG
ncbi:Periplasmic divalent cation tolerance protein CutA [hydrothermal vent metagenome]|uniref:Periplasmic divalent cation tolerance protein CutA n=1 Tax=hydrothermal vent metagenome TaxID=652676 RepID=A0A3B1CAK0_9ZZZZ